MSIPKSTVLLTEWQQPLSGAHSTMMEKLAQPGEVRGVHAHPLSLYLPSHTKLQCTLQLYTHPTSSLLINICTLWSHLPRGENAGGDRDPDQVVHRGEQEVHPDPGDRLLGQLQARHHVQQVVPDQHQPD
jgi:hypothetical protein